MATKLIETALVTKLAAITSIVADVGSNIFLDGLPEGALESTESAVVYFRVGGSYNTGFEPADDQASLWQIDVISRDPNKAPVIAEKIRLALTALPAQWNGINVFDAEVSDNPSPAPELAGDSRPLYFASKSYRIFHETVMQESELA